MFGFINISKPKGMTSHDVVSFLRRVTKIKQIGHTGTLDPFAEGVLPVCIGKATRLIEYLDDDKAYVGTIQLGSATETYDIEGRVIKTSDKKISQEVLEEVLSVFRGTIEQYPPIYSAIKVNGKKLYEYARTGESVEIKPRTVTIDKLELISFDEEKQIAEIYIACSKGTYIRSIANDIGEKLGVFGHLIKLVRVKAGLFDISKAVSLEEIKEFSQVEKVILNPLEYLNYPKIEITEEETKKILNGINISIESKNGIAVLLKDNFIIAVVDICNNKTKILKVFPQ